jgi:alanine racemase
LSLDGSWVDVSEDRLQGNLRTFRGLLRPETKLLTVVKSNAYGHGLELTSKTIADLTDWFGVDSVSEARTLDGASGGKPILILGYFAPEHAAAIVERGFRQVVYRMDTARALSGAAEKQGRPARVHLKIETGTNRQGVPLAEIADFGKAVAALPGIDIEGAYTHFANIEDTLDPSFAKNQLERFRTALGLLADAGIHPPETHAAATAGILLHPETHFSMVRLGIGAYGIWPSRETRIATRERGLDITLEPALTWKTRIGQLKQIHAGEYVGYGLSYQASRDMTLAVIPAGYYEGYDRHLSNAGRALVHGQAVPVVGRVAMNMTILDITDLSDPRLDDEVVLLGRQGDAEITADELADSVGTISYEILARINPLLERRKADGGT